jgi:hypothetical protein
MVAREVKALTTSAWCWLAGKGQPVQYGKILGTAVRVADPYLQVHERWVLRRLAPDCSRVELSDLASVQDECRLLYMMGWETANVHLGNPARRTAIRTDLKSRKSGWLCTAARSMRDATVKDWRAWRG